MLSLHHFQALFGFLHGARGYCSRHVGPACGEKPAWREQTVRMAGIVLKWVRGDKQTNYRRVEPLIREAASTGRQACLHVGVFSRRLCCGRQAACLKEYQSLGKRSVRRLLQEIGGPGAELKIHLVAGLTEASGKSRYNAAVPDRPRRQADRQVPQAKIGPEADRNSAGSACPVFDTPFGKVGLAIGADRIDPATVRRFYDQGASVLLCPAGAYFPVDNILTAQARSTGKQLHIASVHRSPSW